jgi:hypothetical protein
MSAVDEARWNRRSREQDIVPHTAGAEDPETTPEEIAGMVGKVFGVGYERKRELDELVAKRDGAIEHLRDGTYWIRHSHVGQYADFHERANHEYLKKKYPWLHDVSEGLGFDEDKGVDSHNTFEDFLASIPHEDWNSFLEDMDTLEDYPMLDEDRASELEMEEGTRWVTEDGGPDLIESMRDNVNDAYEGYLLGKVTTDLIFEWMRETDHYPEAQGQGDVWMRMEELGKERETQEWFLDQLDDDVAGWTAAKKDQFEDQAGDMLDRLIRRLAETDEDIAHVYNRIDADVLWNIFLNVFPDEPRSEGEPYWYFWEPQYNVPGVWRVGYESDTHNLEDWKRGLADALTYIGEQEWFIKLIRNWFNRAPEGHPQLKLEALEQEPDPDDPATFMRYGGGLAEEKVYEDDRIVVMYPRDHHTLNYHLRLAGIPEIEKQTWGELFKYHDIFVVQGKTAPDMLGHAEKRELGVIWGDENGLRVFTGTRSGTDLNSVLKNPEYGKSVRRMLIQYYRERLEKDWKASNVLLQLGGAPEVRRAERRGLLGGDMSTPMGLYYIQRHKYGLAAKAFKRSPSTITAKGVWLFYDDVDDLASVFKNEEAAQTVFANDHYDWFQHYWERGNRPEAGDVLPFLDEKAINHIREILVNRRVWFPDGGPDGQGEYVVLTPKIVAEYDNDTILDWLGHPSDEDTQDGVFDDIIEALQTAGVRMLEQTHIDATYTGYISAAVEAIGGTEHKWVKHPTKKGSDAFAVFVPWTTVLEQAQKFQDEHGYPPDSSLESLAVDVNADTAEVDVDNLSPGWRDVNKDYVKEYAFDDLYELEAPDPPPGAPNYQDPNQMALPIPESVDDPEAMPQLLSGIPVELENRVKAILRDSMQAHGYTATDLKFDYQASKEYDEEEIDASDGHLHNMRPPHHILTISYKTEPEPEDYGVTRWVFLKVKEAVINTMRQQLATDYWWLNPDVVDPPQPQNTVIFQFHLYSKPEPEPEPEVPGEEVPF